MGDQIKDLMDDLQRGRVSRREFLRHAIGLGISSSIASAVLAACSPAQPSTTGATPSGGARQVRIGFSLGTLAQRRWQFDKRYVEEWAARLGDEVIVQAAEDNEQLQISQAENMIAQGINALILSPINVQTAAPAAQAAKKAGIPVVSYNSVVLNADIDHWVARDNIFVGRLQGQHAVQAAPKGNYVICSGEPGVDIAQEKTKGNMDILQPYIDKGEIKVVSQQYHRGWAPEGALKQIEDALTATNNDIQAVLGNYDGFLLSAMKALGEVGLLGKVFLGGEDVFLEIAQAIVEGKANMSAYTDLEEEASKAVLAAHALAIGAKPKTDDTINNGMKDVPGNRISSIAVTKENMADFLKKTGWLTVEEVYANVPPGERPSP